MSELEIPEGYTQGDWSSYPSIDGHALCAGGKTIATIHYLKGERGLSEEQSGKDVRLIRVAPAMADEIKRLREEKKALTQTIDDSRKDFETWRVASGKVLEENETLRADLKRQMDYTATQQPTREERIWQVYVAMHANAGVLIGDFNAQDAIKQVDAMLAALAKPQTDAFESHKTAPLDAMPKDCEPFDLDRAKKEGAMDKDGNVWKFVRSEPDEEGKDWAEFRRQKDDYALWFIVETGVAAGTVEGTQLYCIAKRLPFDLAKALAGDKVVTRDGKPVTDIQRNESAGGSAAVTGYRNGQNQDFWYEDGRYYSHRETGDDLLMEASV